MTIRAGSLSFGGKNLFENVDLSLAKGQRVCLIGRNGCGKSTLLRVLAQQLELDGGTYFLQPGTQVAYLPQELSLPPTGTVGAWLASQTTAPAYQQEAALETYQLLPERALATLSGGERRRLGLAHLMVQEADVLLLDEPTNHLDLPTTLALEESLLSFRGAIVVISHDRQFLTRISNQTAWLDRGTLRVLAQGYPHFEAWSETILAEEETRLQRLDKLLEAETHWLHRGVTARRKRNQGRLRRLQGLRQERAHHVAVGGSIKPLSPQTDISSRLILETSGLGKSFPQEGHPGQDKWVLKNLTTRIMRGDRIGIIGPNGSGKTTLLKLLSGQLSPSTGTLKWGMRGEVAYFDQHRQSLDPNKTPWEILCPTGGDQVMVQGEPRHVASYLKDFLFTPTQMRSKVSILSGGESNRLLLAKILAVPSHILVLDEPTNDLDMDTLDLLEEMLSDYQGTLLMVSHDRDFLDRLATSLIVLSPTGEVSEYVGGFSDAVRQSGAALPWLKPAQPAGGGKSVSPKDSESSPGSKRETKRPPRLTYQQQRLWESLPTTLKTLEQEIQTLEATLADSTLYQRDPAHFQRATETLQCKRQALEAAEGQWLELAEFLEA